MTRAPRFKPTITSCHIVMDKIVPGGQTLGTYEDGRKIFLWNTLPGEIVTRAQITAAKSSFLEGIALDFENPSPLRVDPRDPCYLATSPWQILDWPSENQIKADLVAEIFREHHLSFPQPIASSISDDHDYFYRNKMEYSFYWDHGLEQILLAFHARGTHRKLPITQSSLEYSDIFKAANSTVSDLNAEGATARDFQTLLIRSSRTGEVSANLYVKHRPHPKSTPLCDTILGQDFYYSPLGFFQVNLPVYELALKDIKRFITTHKVLDLYAGVGSIGLSVAPDRELTLVELDKNAYQSLEANRDNFVHTHPDTPVPTILHAKSEEALDYITSDTTVIVDPPRAGCHQDLIARLVEVLPPYVIYLSCNPATQARDLETLLQYYNIDFLQPYNFFPHTPHIENLVVLSSK